MNFKKLNRHIAYKHVKIKGLFLLKEILRKNDYMWKIDLKDASFAVPIHSSSQKYIRFKWKGNLYQFLWICLGLSSASSIFTTNEDPNFGHAEIECEIDNTSRRYFDNGINKKETNSSEGHFGISSSNFGVFDQQKQIYVTFITDFTVSRCGNRFQRNGCITSPGKQRQNYFTVSRHSKREIGFYKRVDTDVRSSLFHSHCIVRSTSSVSSNSKKTDSRTCKYKKIRLNDSFDRGSEKRTAMVGGEPVTNQRKNLDKFTTPNNNINQCFFGRLGGLIAKVKW